MAVTSTDGNPSAVVHPAYFHSCSGWIAETVAEMQAVEESKGMWQPEMTIASTECSRGSEIPIE